MKERPSEKPILFSAPLVRALIAGTKSQTRRIVKLPPPEKGVMQYCQEPDLMRAGDFAWVPTIAGNADGVAEQRRDQHLLVPYRHEDDSEMDWKDCGCDRIHCPYGAPDIYGGKFSSRLWVRETWAKCTGCFGVDWLADANKGRHCRHCDSPLGKGKPSIHLPKSHSRLTLEIVSVRVERLNEISEADARAEGIEWTERGPLHAHYQTSNPPASHNFATAKEAYADLWDSINGAGSFALNSWVWAISFRVLEGGVKP